jgi:hypothetical protein
VEKAAGMVGWCFSPQWIGFHGKILNHGIFPWRSWGLL